MVGVPPVLDLRAGLADPAELDPVVAHVGAGGLAAYPTETVYGFGGLATAEGVAALRRLKPRGDAPYLVLLPAADAAPGLTWTACARELASVFWPGALTLVLDDPAGSFPAGVRSGDGGVAVRISSHPVARALVERLGRPLTSTSANAPGQPPAARAEQVLATLQAAGAGDAVRVVDAGPLPPSAPSTVVDCRGVDPIVMRAGATPIHRLRCVLPGIHGKR